MVKKYRKKQYSIYIEKQFTDSNLIKAVFLNSYRLFLSICLSLDNLHRFGIPPD